MIVIFTGAHGKEVTKKNRPQLEEDLLDFVECSCRVLTALFVPSLYCPNLPIALRTVRLVLDIPKIADNLKATAPSVPLSSPGLRQNRDYTGILGQISVCFETSEKHTSTSSR